MLSKSQEVLYKYFYFNTVYFTEGEGRGKAILNYAMQAHWNRGIAPLILNLGTRWRRVVNFTPRPLYPRETDAS